MNKPYRGRFAPSPTGELHFGSLVAAVGSYLQARSNRGQWLIRIEDIDPPREVPGSAERIVAELSKFGMLPDEPVSWQSQRREAHDQAWKTLLRSGEAFYCGCSRGDLPASGIYPGTCRHGLGKDKHPRSVRFRVPDQKFKVDDRIQKPVCQDLGNEVGDFVIRRAGDLIAYHLAVVVDDAWQEITEVVRGYDLIGSSPRQIALQQALGLQTPEYVHLPLALGKDGYKLSKRTQADPVSSVNRSATLACALEFLGHKPPTEIIELSLLWRWAIEHWQLARVPTENHLPAVVCGYNA